MLLRLGLSKVKNLSKEIHFPNFCEIFPYYPSAIGRFGILYSSDKWVIQNFIKIFEAVICFYFGKFSKNKSWLDIHGSIYQPRNSLHTKFHANRWDFCNSDYRYIYNIYTRIAHLNILRLHRITYIPSINKFHEVLIMLIMKEIIELSHEFSKHWIK